MRTIFSCCTSPSTSKGGPPPPPPPRSLSPRPPSAQPSSPPLPQPPTPGGYSPLHPSLYGRGVSSPPSCRSPSPSTIGLSLPCNPTPQGLSPYHSAPGSPYRSGSASPSSARPLEHQGLLLYSEQDLQTATRGWHPDCIIGRGRSATVYSATLHSSEKVAIKRLERDQSDHNLELDKEFKLEKNSLKHLHHDNIIVLRGICDQQTDPILVLDLIEGGTLYASLHGTEQMLGWEARMNIALGVARAIDYMHHAVPGPMLHRDIKTSHILIDREYKAKLIDFGKCVHWGTIYLYCGDVLGTDPYIAPEYTSCNMLSTKCDIYSFGVVLLELISNREPAPEGGMTITEWASMTLPRNLNQVTDVREMFDRRILDAVPREDRMKVLSLAVDCIRQKTLDRPSSKQVVDRLLGVSCLAKTAAPGGSKSRGGT